MTVPSSNPLRDKLQSDEPIIGTWISIGHPDVIEIVGTCGFDWFVIDMEHAPIGVETMHRLLQANGPDGPAPVVRVPPGDTLAIQQSLDGGAAGVIVPQVNSVEEAERAVRACLYPPDGTRGMGPRRCTGYGVRFSEYLDQANDIIFIGVQIETEDAVRNVDEILSVGRIDAAVVGLGDLSSSLGCVKNRGVPKMLDAVDKVLDACGKHEAVPCLGYVGDADTAKKYLDKGFRMIGLGQDDMFMARAARAALSGLKRP